MATKTDVYNVKSKSSLGGLKAAISSIKKMGVSVRSLAKSANAAGGKIVRATFNIRNLGKVAGGAVRGLSSLARGFGTLLAGGLLAVVGILRGLPGLFGAMREAVEGAGDAASSAGSDLTDVAEAGSEAASSMSNTATAAVEAATEIEGVFGAIGKVGEGFIQSQAEVFGKTEDIAAEAIETAQDASEAMDDYQDAVGGAVKATSTFGSALDRIGNAWTQAKNTILSAIATALTPALEALADLMESPEFEAFVKLIAEDLADAAADVADWFINEATPAIQDFMEEVEKAGGPIEFLKDKWEELKLRAQMVLGIIVGAVLIASNRVRDTFSNALDAIKNLWNILKLSIIITLNKAAETAQTIMDGMSNTIKGTINSLISGIETAMNAARRIINPFIALYNAVADATGGRKLDEIARITLPRLQQGGIISDPTLAIVGDARTPEVIAPLDDLVRILQETFGEGGLGGPSIGTVQVIVNADPGGLSLGAAGRAVGDSFVEAMRARGIQFSAR